MHTGFCWGNLRERDHLKDPDVGRRIILGWIYKKWDGGGTGWIDLAQHKGQVAGTCKRGNTSGSINEGKFFEEL
jgi:hypothetical protein